MRTIKRLLPAHAIYVERLNDIWAVVARNIIFLTNARAAVRELLSRLKVRPAARYVAGEDIPIARAHFEPKTAARAISDFIPDNPV